MRKCKVSVFSLFSFFLSSLFFLSFLFFSLFSFFLFSLPLPNPASYTHSATAYCVHCPVSSCGSFFFVAVTRPMYERTVLRCSSPPSPVVLPVLSFSSDIVDRCRIRERAMSGVTPALTRAALLPMISSQGQSGPRLGTLMLRRGWALAASTSVAVRVLSLSQLNRPGPATAPGGGEEASSRPHAFPLRV